MCQQLSTFASPSPANESNLVKAFLAKCNVNNSGPDWYVDFGASDHMVSSSVSVNQPEPFGRDGSVHFGNGNTLPISSIGFSSFTNGIHFTGCFGGFPSLEKFIIDPLVS